MCSLNNEKTKLNPVRFRLCKRLSSLFPVAIVKSMQHSTPWEVLGRMRVCLLQGYLSALSAHCQKCPLNRRRVFRGSSWRGWVLLGISRCHQLIGLTLADLTACLDAKRQHKVFSEVWWMKNRGRLKALQHKYWFTIAWMFWSNTVVKSHFHYTSGSILAVAVFEPCWCSPSFLMIGGTCRLPSRCII